MGGKPPHAPVGLYASAFFNFVAHAKPCPVFQERKKGRKKYSQDPIGELSHPID